METTMNGTLVVLSREEMAKLIEEGVARALAPYTSRQKDYFTRRELADRFSVHISTIHNWMNEGKLNAVKVGGRTLFRAEEVERLENESKIHRIKRQ